MMIKAAHAGFAILCSVSCASAGGASSTQSEDICTTSSFRDAFLDGQIDVIDDYTGPSATLIAFGNRALPCLEGIVEHGGAVYGISGCRQAGFGCESWALTAIRRIATAEARNYLVNYLGKPKDPYLTTVTARALGSLRDPLARSALLRALSDANAQVRSAAVSALGAIGNRADVEPMLAAARKLPDDELRTALQGFRMMGDISVGTKLRERIVKVGDPDLRASLLRELEQGEAIAAEESETLAVLKSGSGPQVVAALRKSSSASAPMLDAIRELLDSSDPDIRAEAIASLGKRNSGVDFDRMLIAVLSLPEDRVVRGANGICQLNDPRAIEPLDRYAAGMSSAAWRQELTALVSGLRKRTAAR